MDKKYKYKLVNSWDANEEFPLDSNTPLEAALEALEALGWRLSREEDEDE